MALNPITEQPWSTNVNGDFVLGDHSKRSAWQNSFFMPADPHVGYTLTCSAGAVNGTHGTVTLSPLVGMQYQTSGGPGGFLQVYVGDTGNGPNVYCVGVNAVNTAFPANALPLAMLVLDGVGRIQSLIDQRPSSLSSAPDLGSGMKESISDATKRALFGANFTVPRTSALNAQIPPDWSLPTPGFLLGAGSVVLSGQVITTPTTYLSTAVRGGQLLVNAITQVYISPSTGLLSFQQASTPGVFPANCLPICEVTTDATGLVRVISDARLSYYEGGQKLEN
jgi:hypothetical protein